MTSQSTNMTNDVLHIREAPADIGPAAGLDARLTSAGLHVETCGDVYGGLAKLCNRQDHYFGAVVVCMDNLTTAEMEFFSISSRLFPQAKVYIYGRERWAGKFAQAFEAGADEELAEVTIQDLLTGTTSVIGSTVDGPASVDPEPIDRDESPETPPILAQTMEELVQPANIVVAPHVPVESHGDLDPLPEPEKPAEPVESEAEEEDEVDDEGAPVRVPWLRYNDKPGRAAPAQRTPPSSTPEELAPLAQRASAEPLLTEEELRALMGDDISAIAPSEKGVAAEDGGDERGPNDRI